MNTSEGLDRLPQNAVAIIGAGPAGLVAANYLKRHGFDPVIFEASNSIGGQWNTSSPLSGVWPGMRTNTSRVLTAFSDLDHAPGTSVYPSHADMLVYLHRYADTSGLSAHLRLSTLVEVLERLPDSGWIVRSRNGGALRSELFQRVVVATGRFTAPAVPEIAGLAGFAGALGLTHSFNYPGAAAFRDKRVLVAGCSISALEIASELATSGARKVIVASRRQRYVLQKLLAGVPADHVAFTRFAARAGEVFPPEALAAGLKNLVVGHCGSPEQFGAPKPDDNIFVAGLTQSQSYLGLVAEGRISARPWVDSIDGNSVRFSDGDTEEVDAILLGTGYSLALPFVSREIAETLGLDGQHIDLYDHTFHPQLDGLGFVGLYPQVGPYFPVLELQARWLSYVWAGLSPAPSTAQMDTGLSAAKARRGGPQEMPMHAMARLFARHAGVEPDPENWPELGRALLFGPLSPASFRLEGADRLPEAAARTLVAAEAFGAVTSNVPTPQEAAQLAALRAAADAKAA
ncbi:flavin-containing monooxygenase [Devosia sp.]|uniref:flavin-containing monooxygenase n=1 Tax=Devosia sp. TaxID=1871048 RepID=UPI002FC8ABC9